MVEIQQNLFDKALERQKARTSTVFNMEDFQKALAENPGFIRAMHCEDEECELAIKEETTATIRCFPFADTEKIADTCFHCGKKADRLAYFAKAY